MTSGCCLPSAANEEWYSPKRPSSTVAVNSSELNTKVSAFSLVLVSIINCCFVANQFDIGIISKVPLLMRGFLRWLSPVKCWWWCGGYIFDNNTRKLLIWYVPFLSASMQTCICTWGCYCLSNGAGLVWCYLTGMGKSARKEHVVARCIIIEMA